RPGRHAAFKLHRVSGAPSLDLGAHGADPRTCRRGGAGAARQGGAGHPRCPRPAPRPREDRSRCARYASAHRRREGHGRNLGSEAGARRARGSRVHGPVPAAHSCGRASRCSRPEHRSGPAEARWQGPDPRWRRHDPDSGSPAHQRPDADRPSVCRRSIPGQRGLPRTQGPAGPRGARAELRAPRGRSAADARRDGEPVRSNRLLNRTRRVRSGYLVPGLPGTRSRPLGDESMKKKTMILIAGVLIAAGGAAAVAGVGEKRARFGHGPGTGAMFAHMGGHGFGFGRGGGLKALDADGDGVITIEEALAARSPVFARIDTNGDGVIDAQEIEAEVNLNTQYWTQAMFHRRDRDGDGLISKEEISWKKYRSERQGARAGDGKDDDRGDRARRAHRDGCHGHGHHHHGWHHSRWRGDRMASRFEKMDLNTNGTLEASEVETAIKPRVTRRVNRMISRFDQDNDGRVTREEFEKPARDRFAMRDINKDGRISEEDLPPMMRGRGILR